MPETLPDPLVVCPYTHLPPTFLPPLRPLCVYVGGHDTNYTALMAALWQRGLTFVIVEHDIRPHPGAVEEMLECAHDWCGFPYRFLGGLHNGLGCAKFSADLTRRHPSVVLDTLAEDNGVHPRGHWCNLDDRVRRQLERRGEVKHAHGPPVEHLKPDRTSHGCIERGWRGEV